MEGTAGMTETMTKLDPDSSFAVCTPGLGISLATLNARLIRRWLKEGSLRKVGTWTGTDADGAPASGELWSGIVMGRRVWFRSQGRKILGDTLSWEGDNGPTRA